MASIGEPACVAPTGDECGEGPVWHEGEQALYWTDINRFLIHRFDGRHGSVKSWFFDEPVTALALTDRDDTLAVALGSRVILWSPGSDARWDHHFHLPDWPAVRLNDGRADPFGGFWVGSMRNNVRPDGSPGEAGGNDGVLHCIKPDGKVQVWKRGIGISNTLTWSPDRSRFYFGDTLENAIYIYDVDHATGEISNERPFFTGFARGLPDGSAMDSEGYLWNCRYGGGCIVRVAPDGSVDRVIEMPSVNITSCTFGGKDLKTLYVTTAAAASDPGDRLAGSLFAIDSDVAGQPENRYRAFAGCA
ncbi:MAG: SMP-30/gluconolactonase/LRE family protein [Acidobacteriota bacterium]|nr:SMP-30/gluconolactonase/LRE family protein [Acidobacteriota bacterium]